MTFNILRYIYIYLRYIYTCIYTFVYYKTNYMHRISTSRIFIILMLSVMFDGQTSLLLKKIKGAEFGKFPSLI